MIFALLFSAGGSDYEPPFFYASAPRQNAPGSQAYINLARELLERERALAAA